MMNMGSDNIINPEIWNLYRPLIATGSKFFGLRNFHAYGTVEKEAIYFDNYNKDRAAGAGRMIHKSCIKQVLKHCELYNSELSDGMDTVSRDHILKYCDVDEIVINTDHPLILGIKSATNINPYILLKAKEDKVTVVEFEHIKPFFYD